MIDADPDLTILEKLQKVTKKNIGILIGARQDTVDSVYLFYKKHLFANNGC